MGELQVNCPLVPVAAESECYSGRIQIFGVAYQLLFDGFRYYLQIRHKYQFGCIAGKISDVKSFPISLKKGVVIWA